MLQTQSVNQTTHLQNKPSLQGKNKGNHSKDAVNNSFEDMLGQRGVKQARQADAYQAGPRAEHEPRTKQTRQEELPPAKQLPEDAEQNPNLYLVPPLTPPTQTQPETAAANSGDAASAEVLQMIEDIVSILEGKTNKNLSDTGIISLLAKLEQALTQLDEALPTEFTQMLEELMARMPQSEGIAETPPNMDKLSQFINTLRGYLCPPENVNDETKAAARFAPELLPPDPPPARGAELGGLMAETRQDHQAQAQVKTEDSGNNIPDNASFSVAAPRALFAERLTALNQPPAQPLTAENLFDTMVQRIVSLPDAEPHMEITLKPDHLGKLSIDLQLTENGLTAKIIASDEGVRNLLASHLNRLSETLAERGIRVENVEVAYAPLGDKPFDQRQEHPQQSRDNGRQGDFYRAEASGGEPALAWNWDNAYELPYYAAGLDLGLSSVEYRA